MPSLPHTVFIFRDRAQNQGAGDHRSRRYRRAQAGGVKTARTGDVMAKAKYERRKPHVNIGSIGHVDHSKTTLTSALTKVCAERGLGKFVGYDEVAKASVSQGRRNASEILQLTRGL